MTTAGTLLLKFLYYLPHFLNKILDALKAALRDNNYVPIVFDFEKAASKDITETVKVLAGMCLFIIADIATHQGLRKNKNHREKVSEFLSILFLERAYFYRRVVSHFNAALCVIV